MRYWDWEEWCFTGFAFLLVVGLTFAISSAIKSDNDYADRCHARGGEPVMSASPKLCRDGNTLINVYKEGK